MAEFLIKAVDATQSDPTKDAAGCYKRGDIVVVKPDGWEWGAEERLPRFVQVKVSGLSVARALKLISPAIDGGGLMIRRRLYQVVLSELPAGVRTQLATTGRYETTLAAVESFVRDKIADTRGIPQ